MNNSNQLYKNTLDDIEADGLYKKERIITTPQSVKIKTNKANKLISLEAFLTKTPKIKRIIIDKDKNNSGSM